MTIEATPDNEIDARAAGRDTAFRVAVLALYSANHANPSLKGNLNAFARDMAARFEEAPHTEAKKEAFDATIGFCIAAMEKTTELMANPPSL